jgi:hypothetical protein
MDWSTNYQPDHLSVYKSFVLDSNQFDIRLSSGLWDTSVRKVSETPQRSRILRKRPMDGWSVWFGCSACSDSTRSGSRDGVARNRLIRRADALVKSTGAQSAVPSRNPCFRGTFILVQNRMRLSLTSDSIWKYIKVDPAACCPSSYWGNGSRTNHAQQLVRTVKRGHWCGNTILSNPFSEHWTWLSFCRMLQLSPSVVAGVGMERYGGSCRRSTRWFRLKRQQATNIN